MPTEMVYSKSASLYDSLVEHSIRLTYSAHALMRKHERKISFSVSQIRKIENTIEQARHKTGVNQIMLIVNLRQSMIIDVRKWEVVTVFIAGTKTISLSTIDELHFIQD